MKRRILALSAAATLAVTALAPAAQGAIHKDKVQPPSCHTLIGNYVVEVGPCQPDTEDYTQTR